MTMFLLLVIAVLVFVWPFTLKIAHSIGVEKAIQKPAEYKHEHLWGKWEKGIINIVSPTTGKKIYSHTTQERTCETCGYEEVEKLKSY
jgi:ribosomal protein L37E